MVQVLLSVADEHLVHFGDLLSPKDLSSLLALTDGVS